uniref:Protein wos2 (Trinotate prediction) n=1 Tax=Henneguya salminicola TaxID=69463 RepID=A0A6G3MHZ1_HENSL
MSKIPEIKWRQDKEFVNLSFKVLDASKADIKFTEQQVDFKATTDEHVEYAVVLECFNEIDPKNSSYQILGREVYVKLKKTEAKSWPKLLKSGKPYYLKADWSHTLYDSEDEAEPEIGV